MHGTSSFKYKETVEKGKGTYLGVHRLQEGRAGLGYLIPESGLLTSVQCSLLS